MRWLILSVWLLLAQNVHAACFELAAQRYQVPVALLKAIAMQESGGRAHAVNRNPNGSYDIGMMQINSFWLPTLARHGITQQDLFDPCVSVLVGAWVLSDNFTRLGYTTQGLGAYNASTPYKRERYARAILQRLGHNNSQTQHPAPRGTQAPTAPVQNQNSHIHRP
jgi:soluble lytic murein transglycosylase-like protein